MVLLLSEDRKASLLNRSSSIDDFFVVGKPLQCAGHTPIPSFRGGTGFLEQEQLAGENVCNDISCQ